MAPRSFLHWRISSLWPTFRLASPFEVVATPDDEQLESIIRALTFYQPPYSPARTPLGEFLFLFHAASEVYTKPDAVTPSCASLAAGRATQLATPRCSSTFSAEAIRLGGLA